MSEDIRMSPVFLAPADRKITVFGGGKVALRKCRHFKGFEIKVIAEEILPEIRELAHSCLEATVTAFNAGEFMEGADIVLASTSSKEINFMIRDIAKEKRIPVNSAHGGGDVLIPSTLRRKGFTVTVSSEGRAPAFPPYVIREIDSHLDDGYEKMLELLVELRPKVMGQIPKQPDRARILAEILENQEIWNMLRSGDTDDAYEHAIKQGGLNP